MTDTQETLAEEFARLIEGFVEDKDSTTGAEAWNLIADFAVANAADITGALRHAEPREPASVPDGDRMTTEGSALEAAWKICSAWDGKITKPVLRKVIAAYIKEIAQQPVQETKP